MRILIIVSGVLFLWSGLFPAYGQNLSFTLNDYMTLPHSRSLRTISGIEYLPAKREWQLAGDRGQYHLLKDIQQLTDWITADDSTFSTGLWLEAVRYDATSDTYYFAVENDDESYVGFKKHSMPRAGEPFGRLPLPHPMPSPKTNKGIEGLALTDRYLWVAPEAGSADEATTDNSLIHFYRYRKTGDSLVFDGEFSYEIDRNICPDEPLGGVSEIIALPGEENRLLVLERCYQKPAVTARLYEARVDEGARQLVKQKDRPAFDFNHRNGFSPDNLEAMSWGEDQDGRKTLILFSDDNAGKNQWTQILQLSLVPDRP